MGRRAFLGVLGTGAAAGALTLAGCSRKKDASQAGGSQSEPPIGQMTYRTDPRTGKAISLLGYGCMRLPKQSKTGAPSSDAEVDQEAVNASVDYALAHGVNYFDTAPVYCKGTSERAMGIALSRHPRDRYVVATKMSNMMGNSSREESIDLYHNSMKELQVDYLDYYLLHAVGTYASYKERFLDNGLLDFLLKEREAGRIRNLGWSFHGERKFFDYMLSCGVKWDFVQIQANYFEWGASQGPGDLSAKYLYDELARVKVPAIIMEPLLGGRLASLPHKALAELKQADPTASIASWAFRFAGSWPNVLTVLSGMTYMEHVQDNLRTYSPLKPLTDGEFAMLERASQAMHETPIIGCTSCQYCMPCPYGIDIPGVFSHYDRCLSEGRYPGNDKDPNYREAHRAFLVGLDRSVPRLRQAQHCTGCGTCNPRCPQWINISEEMKKIDRFIEHLKVTG